ncbi:MAG: DUF448 domain-containing protein [Fusobacteriaceae bacterium]|nr:DUF448 domain-containing protein [Fusobacteriaceae bacterium]MBP6322269.1 DUF448 domain-containing protein [Fusobacteriaceae bacterium]MBP9509569.1 DUF448 domain-containing protein [Fusobacteriaceae bacterium]
MNSIHSPERTCAVCKVKMDKSELFRIVEQEDGSYLFDKEQKEQKRGTYVCKSKECLQKLSKHKKIKISMEELCKMANSLKKDNKDYLNILKTMRNSQALAFGMNMVFDEIEQIHFIIMAEDISEKNGAKLIAKAKEYNIPYIYYGNKNLLGDIFSKEEVTVIAVKNKKIARGLVN